MQYNSVFDIIGPVMVGPSSSHTAGAARIGKVAHDLFGQKPEQVDITFYASFAKTYKGHGTDVAVAAGILGFESSDVKLRDSLGIAEREGIQIRFQTSDRPVSNPNTMKIKMWTAEKTCELTACSLGGGKIRIVSLNGFETGISGESPVVLVFHQDVFGTVAAVTKVLADDKINIAHMGVSRKMRGEDALMIIETDQSVGPEVAGHIEKLEHVTAVLNIFSEV